MALSLSISLTYFLAAVPYALLGLFAWRKRPTLAAGPFAWAMLGLSIWTLSYGAEVLMEGMRWKILALKAQHIGIVTIPVSLLIFALEYTGRKKLLNIPAKLVLWFVPVLTFALAFTNELHQWMWTHPIIINNPGFNLLKVERGPFFWINTTYAYALIVMASVLLMIEFIQRPGVYRLQAGFVALGVMIPLAGGTYLEFNPQFTRGLNLLPLLFFPTGLGLAWAIAQYRLLDLLPPEYQTVLTSMKDGVIVMDARQRVMYINPIIEQLFRCREADALGQPLSFVAPQYASSLIPYLSLGGEHRVEIRLDEGAQMRVFEADISPIAPTSQANSITVNPNNMIVLRDVTHRKKTEAALIRRESIMSAISMAAEQFLRESSWEHNIPGVLENIGTASNASRVSVFMNYMDSDNTIHVSLCYEWAAMGVPAQIHNPNLKHASLRSLGLDRWLKMLTKGEPFLGHTKDFPDSERAFFEKLGTVSLAVAPVFVENQWWGFLLFEECFRERYWNDIEIKSFLTAASIFGSAESRARVEQKLLRRQEAFAVLHEIVSEALKANDLKSMGEYLSNRLADLIRADGCFLNIWDEVSGQVIPLAAYGQYKESYISSPPVKGKRTFTESALKLGHTLVVDDALSSPYVDIEIARKYSSRSLIVLPLIAGQRKLGAFIIAFDNYHRFQPEEISIAEQAANLFALAFEKIQAVETARRRAQESETLRKAGALMTEALDVTIATTRILEQLIKVVPYDSASVQLLRENELEIIGANGFEHNELIIGVRFPVPGENPNSVVVQSGKPYLIAEIDYQKYPGFGKTENKHIRSWLGIPLIVQSRMIGLLAVDSAQPNRFSLEDIERASVFADQAAVALENSRMFESAHTQAVTDPLTGVYNRRGLFQMGEFEFMRAKRSKRSLCAMIFDIDHFKRINDHYGHASGDQALRKLAERCRAVSRSMDIVGRYGGEEFVALLPDTTLETGQIVGERMRHAIMDEPIPTESGPLHITISVGVAHMREGDTLSSLIDRADEALYRAKNSGRNCVMLEEQPASG